MWQYREAISLCIRTVVSKVGRGETRKHHIGQCVTATNMSAGKIKHITDPKNGTRNLCRETLQ
jgi:hypothetical protein